MRARHARGAGHRGAVLALAPEEARAAAVGDEGQQREEGDGAEDRDDGDVAVGERHVGVFWEGVDRES